jgi:cytochrome c peroxidase
MAKLFPDVGGSAQNTPPVIPQLEIGADPGGDCELSAEWLDDHREKCLFQSLGANNRVCFTCLQPQDGWALSARHAQERFSADPEEPLFRLIDGATCPSDDVSTSEKKRAAYRLLLDKGLIRVGLTIPSNGLEFRILAVNDLYGCNTSPVTGLTGQTTGTVSVYRRPLPAANLGFLSTIMWNGREPSLFSQAVDATRGHAEGTVDPTAEQLQQIVSFEGGTQALTPDLCANTPATGGVFAAQISDAAGIDLSGDGGNRGPVALSKELPKFFIGINDPLGQNPTGKPFNPEIFNLYSNRSSLPGDDPKTERQRAIARGEDLFNNTKMNITGVAGLNDALHQESVTATCGICHDNREAGNYSVPAPLNIGVADAGENSPPALDIDDLPVFTIWSTSEPLSGKLFEVTDPGRGLITGKCADTEGADPPRSGGARAVFPQWLGCHVGGCGGVLQPAFRHWIYRTVKGRPRRVSKLALSLVAAVVILGAVTMDYESFFKKRLDVARRRTVSRLRRSRAALRPLSAAYDHRIGVEVTVWCSNAMLGIGFHDRHALPHITPIKCADRELRFPPA